ncbi:MAG: PQQ-dependent sugar dehydrogenase [Rudaea sp.]|nr:PQQ-dependent sugar dehydrogenase [Rudaea sp.]
MRDIVAVILAGLTTISSPAAVAAQTYAMSGDCDGFPKVGLDTAAGSCIGLVAGHLGFARGVAAIGTDIYVADMGGWQKNRGRIVRLPDGGHGQPHVILNSLNEPNSLVPGPDGTLYVGLSGAVIRFDPAAADPQKSLRNIVTGLPTQGRHPLAALALGADGSLFVNVGSATDHCERQLGDPAPGPQPCPETQASPPRATILRVAPGDTAVDARTLVPYARGLRNSMALTVLGSGRLLAAVNARDAINQADPALSDAELPHDTLVRVEQGADYGWPYCFDENRPSPEYAGFDCSGKRAPTLLLPAHAAPLGMIFYRGRALAGLEGHLLIAYHGYRSTGHRIVKLAIDAQGRPRGVPEDVVTGWEYARDNHPQGAVVALWEMDDGSVLVTEDHNGTLLRLARDKQ